MSQKRIYKQYPQEFKEEAVALVDSPSVSDFWFSQYYLIKHQQSPQVIFLSKLINTIDYKSMLKI